MGAMEVMLAFPSIILAIAIATILGPSIENLMLAVGIANIPQYARLARAGVLAIKEREYVEAARAVGASDLAIVVRQILPNVAAPLLAQATLGIATAELGEGGGLVVSWTWGTTADAGMGSDAQRRARLLSSRPLGP